jgi:addiction module RelE/StbE family toxin
MELHFKKSFLKLYKKLSPQEQLKVDQTLVEFQIDPHHANLRNHGLKGAMKGQRAISSGFELRIIYREEGGHAVVYLIKTGAHNQVY